MANATDDAIALFGDRDASSIVLLKDFESYFNGYEENGVHVPGYKEQVEKLLNDYPIGKAIKGEEAEADFIKQYSSILRSKNVLNSFDSFEGNEILSERDFQDYQSIYIDLYEKYRERKQQGVSVACNDGIGQNQPVTLVDVIDDLVFEMELVEQLEVTIDYILNLVEIYHNSNCEDKEVLTFITKAIGSSPHLRKKKDLIEAFVSTVNSKTNVNEDWKKYVQEKKEEELNRIISEEKLKPEETRKFLDNSFRDGILKEGGTDIDKIMPKVSLFAKGANNRATKKKGILQRLKEFFEKFLGLV